jgi:hypothetical protein
MNRKGLVIVAYLLLVGLASYYFTTLWFELNWELRGVGWDALLRGEAPTPFQYRALVFWLVKGLARLGAACGVAASIPSLFFRIEFYSMMLLVLAFRAYLRLFWEGRTASIISLTIFLILPYNLLLGRVLAVRYPSDIPSILFFTAGLILLYKRNWLLFYPLFALATLNRETSCFLTVVYILVALGCEKNTRIVQHVFAQLVIWVSIKYWLHLIYLSNRGDGLCLWNYRANVDFLTHPSAYRLFLSNLGYLWIPVLLFWRRIPDLFVRRSTAVIPVFFAAMFIVGNMWELRIYAELIPVALTAFFMMLKGLWAYERQ